MNREDDAPGTAETGTVLDYLWEGQQGSAFEPVEADAPQASAEYHALELGVTPEKNAPGPAPTNLDSTLNRYNIWLASLQSNPAQEGRE